MAAAEPGTCSMPVAIAAAPARASSTELGANESVPPCMMPYTCQPCAKRKVKCDKATPICARCRKGRVECLYHAPPPRRRKRQLSDDVVERLARYERILDQHGLLPLDAGIIPPAIDTPQEPTSLPLNEPAISRMGKLLGDQGKSRYLDSNLWHDIGDDEMQHMSDDEGEDQMIHGVAGDLPQDPLTGAFMGSQLSLLEFHPTRTEALMLWKTYTENVEPICRILHIPSTRAMLDTVSQEPRIASKAEECLLFAIYHFATVSLTDEQCMRNFEQSQETLVRRYHFATRQALVNAMFLKTTEMPILQALVLFLIPCRYSYDPHTYWILTGVAVRIAQRMGLHRDGEKLGLPPFDVHMRRRLFYQVIPLDGRASEMTGTGMAIMPDTWDTMEPLNINDDQIWPGMTERPIAQKGASEMIFCLARSCIGKCFIKASRSMTGAGARQLKDYRELEPGINEAENEVEEKYLRYCNIIDPLHFLTIAMARSAVTAMRIRTRLPKVRDGTVTDEERRELVYFSFEIIDTETAGYAHNSLRRYAWHMRSFWVWGSWDSIVLLLTSLRNPGLLSRTDVEAAWSRVEQVYNNHSELLVSKRALHVAIGRLTLKAWGANPPVGSVPDPFYIATLRSMTDSGVEPSVRRDIPSSSGVPITGDVRPVPVTLPDGTSFDNIDNFDLDSADDWVLWDQLVCDYQAQGD